MTGTREGAIARAQACFDDGILLDRLRALIAVPTESQLPDRLPELVRYCSETLPAVMAGMGFTTALLENPEPGRGPAFLATRIEDPARPTVLIYGHGDVVRGLAGRWREGRDPWTVTVEGERWYGRGTADNKGQHLLGIEALRAVLAERGRLGFNAKVFVETGEEVGSPGLRAMLRRDRDRLAADVFIGIDGPRQSTRRAELTLGARGGVALDLVVRLREGAHHSGHWGGVLADPGFILAHALAAIVTPQGRIRVPGWLPAAVPEPVRALCRALEIEPMPGLPEADPGWGEPGLTKAERIYAWTSVIVLAQLTGHPDAPTNAVQGEARARLQVRHTVDVPAEAIVPALRAHLDAAGLTRVEIRPVLERDAFPPWRTDPDHPWVRLAARSLARTTGVAANIVPNSSGSNPSRLFAEELSTPVLWLPNSYPGCHQHGPDEHALAPLLRQGLGLLAGLWWDIGEGAGVPPA